MERVHVALVQLLLLTLAITSGEATKCYQCTSSEPKCNDPFDKSGMEPTECTSQSVDQVIKLASGVFKSIDTILGGNTNSGSSPDLQWTCVKAEFKPTSTSGTSNIVRTCSLPKSSGMDPCVLDKDKLDKPTMCNTCEGDGCNSAVRLGGLSGLFYLLVPCLVALKAVGA